MSEAFRQASFIGAKAVADAEKYLADRSSPALLKQAADQLMDDIFLQPSVGAYHISDATRLLVIVMVRTAAARDQREQRWRDVMRTMCLLVRHEANIAEVRG